MYFVGWPPGAQKLPARSELAEITNRKTAEINKNRAITIRLTISPIRRRVWRQTDREAATKIGPQIKAEKAVDLKCFRSRKRE